MEVTEILQSFDRWPDALPREALREASAKREEIAPELLRSLERALSESALSEDGEYTLQFFAMYLLAQFRDARAYPLIVELFAKHGEVLAEWTGDFVTEGLARVLASVSGGDAGPMKRLAEDRGVDEWVRCAALSGIVILVAEGMMPRDEAMAYYAGLLRGGLEREYSVVWEGLTGCCLDLCPEEVYEDLKRALEEKLVDPMYAKIDYIRECRAEGKDRAMRELRESGRGLIGDVAEELEGWYCFKPRDEDEAEDDTEEEPQADAILDALSDRTPSGHDDGPYVRPEPKVGRNDPCPCGSGKKYKRCCGIPGAAAR